MALPYRAMDCCCSVALAAVLSITAVVVVDILCYVPIVCVFLYVLLCVLFTFSISLTRKRALVALILLSF